MSIKIAAIFLLAIYFLVLFYVMGSDIFWFVVAVSWLVIALVMEIIFVSYNEIPPSEGVNKNGKN